MSDTTVKKVCERCNGDGTVPTGGIQNPGSPDTCPRCLGDGQVEDSYIVDLDTKLDALDVKLDVMEAKLDQIIGYVES